MSPGHALARARCGFRNLFDAHTACSRKLALQARWALRCAQGAGRGIRDEEAGNGTLWGEMGEEWNPAVCVWGGMGGERAGNGILRRGMGGERAVNGCVAQGPARGRRPFGGAGFDFSTPCFQNSYRFPDASGHLTLCIQRHILSLYNLSRMLARSCRPQPA